MRLKSPSFGLGVALVVSALGLAACGSDPATIEDPISSLAPNVTHEGPVPVPAGVQDSAIAPGSATIQGPGGPISSQTWLTQLFPKGKDGVKITEVILPGAHDAGTYGITCDSEMQLPKTKGVSTYEEVATALKWNPIFLELSAQKDLLDQFQQIPEEECPVQALAKAQASPTGGNPDGFINMLDGGIRFFDMRIYDNGAGPGGMDNFVFNHGPVITNASVRTAIDNVLYFAASHPDELVILDLHEVSGHDPKFETAEHDVDLPSLKKMLYDNVYAAGESYFKKQGVAGICDLSISPKSMTGQGNKQGQLADLTLADVRDTTVGSGGDLHRNVLLMAQGGPKGGAAGDLINPDCIWDEDKILQQKWANSNQWSAIVATAYDQLQLRGKKDETDKFLLSQMQPTPAISQYADCIGRGVLSPLTEIETVVSGEAQACSLVGLTQDVTQPPSTYLPGWIEKDLRPNILFADWVLLPDKTFYPDILKANELKFDLG